MTKTERRVFTIGELRITDDGVEGGAPMIAGHAAVFDSPSEEMYGFVETIAPGAFAKTLKDADVRALFNHDPSLILGRSTAGTLRLAEDKTGLAIEIDPPDTQVARDLLVSMERGDVTQMSFGFRTVIDQWEFKDGAEPDLRTLIEVELFDVSPVTFPAYPDTDVAVRSHQDAKDERAAGLAASASYFRRLRLKLAEQI